MLLVYLSDQRYGRLAVAAALSYVCTDVYKKKTPKARTPDVGVAEGVFGFGGPYVLIYTNVISARYACSRAEASPALQTLRCRLFDVAENHERRSEAAPGVGGGRRSRHGWDVRRSSRQN